MPVKQNLQAIRNQVQCAAGNIGETWKQTFPVNINDATRDYRRDHVYGHLQKALQLLDDEIKRLDNSIEKRRAKKQKRMAKQHAARPLPYKDD